MKTRGWITGFLVLGFVAIASAASGGDEKAKKAAPKGPPDEKAMMEAMMKAATPGEAHKKLEPIVGTFEAKVTMWMDPSKPPEESTGISEHRWVLGNRYVEQRYEGTFMGKPFSGIGYTGYDNVKKKYVGTWMDTAGTSIMMSTGTADATGKNMNFSATVDDPMTGKPEKITEKVTVTDNDRHSFEMWGTAPDGKGYKMMEITYTRKN